MKLFPMERSILRGMLDDERARERNRHALEQIVKLFMGEGWA